MTVSDLLEPLSYNENVVLVAETFPSRYITSLVGKVFVGLKHMLSCPAIESNLVPDESLMRKVNLPRDQSKALIGDW